MFELLGDLPGGEARSEAYAVSGDGSTVVGISVSASGIEAFRWTRAEGMVGLGDLPGGNFSSYAFGVSADGSVVVGISYSAKNREAFRWTESEGMVGLGNLGGLWSSAEDVSADGTIVVGKSRTGSGQYQAFLWTLEDGMVGLGALPAASGSGASAVSADGSIVVGNIGAFGFRWTESEGMQPLRNPTGESRNALVYDISGDGSVVVGMTRTDSGHPEAFRWTESEGMQLLGDLPGGNTFSRATATSADGSIVVGWSGTNVGSSVGYYDAFIWDSEHVMRNLTEVLRSQYALDLPIFALGAAKGISDDGLTIAGNMGPIGWVVTLPGPPSMQVVMWLTPQALNPNSKGNWMKAHFVLPEGYAVEDVDANRPCKISEPFEPDIESAYVNVFVNDDEFVAIEAAFDRSKFCQAGISDEVTDVRVEGRFVSGQYFYGTDTIKIITNNLQFLAVFASHWLESDCGAPDWCGGTDLDHSSTVDFADFALFDGCCIEVIKK